MANNTPRIDWAKEWLKETKKPYINGEFVSGHGPVMESVNPATNEVIGHFETCEYGRVDERCYPGGDAAGTAHYAHGNGGSVQRTI